MIVVTGFPETFVYGYKISRCHKKWLMMFLLNLGTHLHGNVASSKVEDNAVCAHVPDFTASQQPINSKS
jgi:hypothetical protein